MSNAAPEGRHTEAHAIAAAWRREHAMPVVLLNRENALQEASRRDIVVQEARQRVVSVTQEAPREINAAMAVHR